MAVRETDRTRSKGFKFDSGSANDIGKNSFTIRLVDELIALTCYVLSGNVIDENRLDKLMDSEVRLG